MNSNQVIAAQQRRKLLALGIILGVQALSMVALSWFLTVFSRELGADFPVAVRPVVLAALGGILMFSDLFFLVTKVLALSPLRRQPPVKCRIEDFFLIGYTDDGKRRYRAYPILRAMEDQRLYLAHGNNALSNFSMKSVQMNQTLVDFTVYARDRTPLRVGDTVYMYLLKTVDIQVRTDEAAGEIQLGRETLPFLHSNENLKINAFENMVFFKGVVDTES